MTLNEPEMCECGHERSAHRRGEAIAKIRCAVYVPVFGGSTVFPAFTEF
jgi:hypothetical protein